MEHNYVNTSRMTEINFTFFNIVPIALTDKSPGTFPVSLHFHVHVIFMPATGPQSVLSFSPNFLSLLDPTLPNTPPAGLPLLGSSQKLSTEQ